MTGYAVDTLAALEAVVGKTPAPVNLKVIDHLDKHALRWIAASPLLFAGIGDGGGLRITLGGDRPGFVAASEHAISLPLSSLDDPQGIEPGMAFGSLFLTPAIGETLRVNGRVAGVEGGVATIEVVECYGHCAKALIRSDFWAADPIATPFADLPAMTGAARFMALATINAAGCADMSPKGDPAGAMVEYRDGEIWFADRPGNRRIDSFRNIIENPRVAMTLIVPGSDIVACLTGRASLSTDPQRRESFAVNDKVPKLAGRIAIERIDMRASPALHRANLWPAGAPADGIDPARMFTDHVKANRHQGVAAQLVSAAVSIPGMMRKGLEKDYKTNLY